MKTGKTLAMVLTGTVAGAALGTLLAPDKGSKTRAKIANQATKVARVLKVKKDEGLKELDRLKKDIVEKAGMLAPGNGDTAVSHKSGTRSRRRSTTTRASKKQA